MIHLSDRREYGTRTALCGVKGQQEISFRAGIPLNPTDAIIKGKWGFYKHWTADQCPECLALDRAQAGREAFRRAASKRSDAVQTNCR